ncbi:hypothetical protein [Hydrotalea sandarakina]|jgi:hypothetical protein|uniref:PKD family protein n=1 Tax=Hydrotalea sandarakina TaxID=1004304 RepID=A0A2W7RTN0_9BACT|nr:hypothetical protein [Hydrotalea sandarakina]PZX63674.1 hypothetical protein LX80_01325 [Hydrotalea sandarakina]
MKKILFYLALLFITISSCKKDFSDEFTPYQGVAFNDTTWTNEPISNSFIDSLQSQIGLTNPFLNLFNPSLDTTVWLKNNIRIKIPGKSCVYQNNNLNAVTDSVQLKLIQIRKRGDFIRYMLSATSGQYPLVVASAFYVTYSCKNQPVSIDPNKPITIQWEDDDAVSGMQYYSGIPNSSALYDINWQIDNTGTVSNWDTMMNGSHIIGYTIQSTHSQWFSAGAPMDTSLGTTNLNVVLPLNFTNKNTLVFAVFNNVRSVLKLTPSAGEKGFYAQHIPTNANITLVSISLINNNLYVGTNVLYGINAGLQKLFPTKISPQALNELLNNL